MSKFTSAVLDKLRPLVRRRDVRQFDVNGVRVYVAPDEIRSELAGMHTLYNLTLREGRVRWDFARAPSMVGPYRSIARHWPQGFLAEEICPAPMDEISGNEYKALEVAELRNGLPKGVLPKQLEIDAGDMSEAHTVTEVLRLNDEIQPWLTDDVFPVVLAGTSPNESPDQILAQDYDPNEFEVHIAFNSFGRPNCDDPYMAIPMSRAASGQQQREGVVEEADTLEGKFVVSMTANHLLKRSKRVTFSLPDKRGVNLWWALNVDPQYGVPICGIQQHQEVHEVDGNGIPHLVVCTTNQSWLEYQAAEQYFRRHDKVLGMYPGVNCLDI